MGEITEKGRQKFTEQISDTHALFKSFVAQERPVVEIEKVGTGEYWYGKRAIELKLADELKTSDEYIFENRDKARIIGLKITPKKSFSDKLSEAMEMGIGRAVEKVLHKNYFL